MNKLIVFTGAGVSAESGIKTFRDQGGLWENYDITQVATPEGFKKDPELVLEFYNERRRNVLDVSPNEAHKAIARLEEKYDVHVITQNIDDLHERAGSSKVLHLHGEILKARSSVDPNLLYEVGREGIQPGDKCEKGSQLRPHVVWFGEPVPAMENAFQLIQNADAVITVGTSLNVYPAAGLVLEAPSNARHYLIDPNDIAAPPIPHLEVIKETASKGMPPLANQLLGEKSA